MGVVARGPHERHDVEAAAQRELVLDLAIGEAAVLHVVEDEVGARALQRSGAGRR